MSKSKKREIRKSLKRPGWITLEGGFAARPCVVEDLSAAGAKITLEDPKAFTRAWKNTRIFTLRPDWEVMEYSCEENNKDLSDGHIK